MARLINDANADVDAIAVTQSECVIADAALDVIDRSYRKGDDDSLRQASVFAPRNNIMGEVNSTLEEVSADPGTFCCVE